MIIHDDAELVRRTLLSREAHRLRERANELRKEYDQTLRSAYRQALQARQLHERLRNALRAS